MAKSLTISDLLSNIPRMRAAAERRIAVVRDELETLESELAQLIGLASSGGARRGRKPGRAPKLRKRAKSGRRPRGSGPSGKDILLKLVNAKGTIATSEAKAAYDKAGLAVAGASVTLNALKKAGLVANGKERGTWTKGKEATPRKRKAGKPRSRGKRGAKPEAAKPKELPPAKSAE